MRLSVHNDGQVVVTLPRLVPEILARDFVREKSDWILKKIKEIKSHTHLPDFSGDEYAKHKLQALELVTTKLEKFNQYYNFHYNRVCIRNQKTRWGSCSSNNNLNFNFKIIFLPDRLADYLVVHELCHLREMNHSYKFWDLVGEQIKDYQNCSKELRKIKL